MTKKLIIQFSLGLSILFGLLILVVEFSNQLSASNNIDSGFNKRLPNFLFLGYVLSVFIFYKSRIEISDRYDITYNITKNLWKILIIGMLIIIVSLSTQSHYLLLGKPQVVDNEFTTNILFLINLGLLTAFLVAIFVVWKRLVLYQKTRRLLWIWTFFESLLLACILLDFIYSKEYFLFIIAIIGFFLSFNMKWVAFLSFKQKWESILLLFFILLYLIYFSVSLTTYRNSYDFLSPLSNSLFIKALLIFTLSYTISSLLVLIFNLPTTSVFEQKLKEVVNFQRLSQSIQTEKGEEEVYKILLESAARIAKVDGAWIQLKLYDKVFLHKITSEKIDIIKISHPDFEEELKKKSDVNKDGRGKSPVKIKIDDDKSLAYFPVWIGELHEGSLFLLKNFRDGFTKELIGIIETFTNQASISIANFRILNEAISNERYKEELKIAKQVQLKLLPEVLNTNDDFEISTFTISADEVGGDYYDSFKISSARTALIIGDVSGKGTSAAFHMAQIKGIFLALVQLNLPPIDFLNKANLAISIGLDKTSFITISYFVIDSTSKSIEFSRAGHVPSLYFNSKENKASYEKNNGLGLGIIRGKKFEKYMKQSSTIHYQPGDLLILYTDGIIEAKNEYREEFGYEKLLHLIEDNKDKNAETIQKIIINTLHNFCDNKPLEDDYSLVVIKFN